jgi:hypothetical protein
MTVTNFKYKALKLKFQRLQAIHTGLLAYWQSPDCRAQQPEGRRSLEKFQITKAGKNDG